VIVIHHRADEASRSPDRPCFYDAEANVLGQSYTVRARYGAVHDLARELVAAGVPDQAVTTVQQPHGCQMGYPSMYRLAATTVSEGPTHPVHGRRWTDPAEAFGRLPPKGQNRGSMPPADIGVPPAEPARVLEGADAA
jgi:hypothetical protein